MSELISILNDIIEKEDKYTENNYITPTIADLYNEEY